MFRGVSLRERPWSWYDPMQEAKTAYLDCAGIGEDLLSDSRSERTDEIQRKVLDFVNKYGPMYVSESWSVENSPGGSPIVPKEGLTFSLSQAAIDAQYLAVALRCYRAIEDPRQLDSAFPTAWEHKEMEDAVSSVFRAFPSTWGSPPYGAQINPNRRDYLEAGLYALINNVGLKGTSPGIYFIESGCWEDAYQYGSLLSAMWLRFAGCM